MDSELRNLPNPLDHDELTGKMRIMKSKKQIKIIILIRG